MITSDRMCKILFAMWICGLRKDNDPDYDIKVETIKEIMNRYGVEGMEDFDKQIEDCWKRHYQSQRDPNLFF